MDDEGEADTWEGVRGCVLACVVIGAETMECIQNAE